MILKCHRESAIILIAQVGQNPNWYYQARDAPGGYEQHRNADWITLDLIRDQFYFSNFMYQMSVLKAEQY